MIQVFSSLRWKLTASFLLVVFSTIGILGIYLEDRTAKNYLDELRASLMAEGRAVSTIAVQADPSDLDRIINRFGAALGRRITVIDSKGVVLADSEGDAATMDSHAGRPEVAAALASGRGYAVRHSDTLQQDMMYAAVRYHGNGRTGVVRLAEPLSQVSAATGRIRITFGITALVALLVGMAVSLQLANRVVAPIVSMTRMARRVARGDFGLDIRAPDGEKDEITELGETLNLLAAELRQTVREIREDKRKMETVFDRTDDGLLILDDAGRIEVVNPAARDILSINEGSALGRTVIEATLSHEFAQLVERVLRTRRPATLEITFPGPPERRVQCYVTTLGESGEISGTAVVMHDVTSARQVDAMRRDFVGNVSHELRTPLASIRAMAETIALRGRDNPEVTRDYSESIVKETERMTRLADDLIEIARMEGHERPMGRDDMKIAQIVADVASHLSAAAGRKGVSVDLDVRSDLVTKGDADALWQILVNLVDNAITYTPQGGRISISAEEQDGSVAISVVDTGIGIPSGDIPRIFERFYRVDKARSRASGGTGLGLSIVKHLVEAYGGAITVRSELGKGSIFTFTVGEPREPRAASDER